MQKIQKFFGTQVLIFGGVFFLLGLLFTFITPPIYAVDESAHWYRAYQVSEFNWVPENVNTQEAGGTLPVAVSQLVAQNMRGSQDKFRFSPASGLEQLRISEKRQLIEFTNVAIYPPTNYLPQATGIGIARLFTSKVLVQFYAGKVGNLIFLTLALMFALKLLPFGKKAFMALALIPMVLYAGASLSADVMVIASVALFMAYLLRLMQERHIATRQWLIVAALAGLVALSKQTYIVLALALFALPFRGRRVSWPDLWKVLGVVGFAGVCLAIWLLIIHGMNVQPIHLQQSVGVYSDPAVQKDFVLHHPLSFIKIMLVSLNNGGIPLGFLGVFGVSDVLLPVAIYYVLVAVLVLAFGLAKDSPIRPLRLTPTLIIVTVVVLHVVCILGGLYVYWTTPYQPAVSGIQGRYFIPDLIMLLPVLLGRYKHTVPPRLVVGAATGVGVVSVIVLIHRFF